ncbi:MULTISPECIES: alpha/beta hydrolase [unclassified Streptomyces]|uniref:alpha/beta hydrolase n=1 Tax=unclassified Streptomyces TaxID=2593676 RepID=UPI000DB9669F|nr:alpha/beta hydrolase [Streptomyces sp. PsTaAH-137]MYT71763.1 alpha/beta fold hydrolase [Streptomyces sp. SID8367]RAJ72597.1 alpha-beta hydrolase superfamily lysophospholipase [Streptomyces sp. PsTaAH-137]
MNRTPVVFIHGEWLHALAWESWAERFAGRGFRALAPGWPGEAATPEETRRSPAPVGDLGLEALTDHYADIARSFDKAPVIVGHAVGGLIAQHLIGVNIGRAAVAIAPAPVDGIPLPGARPALWAPDRDGVEPLVSLSPERFRKVFANTLDAEEAARLFDRYVVPAPRRLLADLDRAGTVRGPYAVADTGNIGRGPLLLISGQEDLIVPDSVTRAAYKAYGDSTAVTDLKQFADRAHSLVVDNGWRFVADHVLGWLDDQGIRAHPEER